MARGTTQAASAGDAGFSLGLQGFPCGTTPAQLGGAVAGPFPRRSRLCDFLVFPMVFGCFMETVLTVFFWPGGSGQKPWFL